MTDVVEKANQQFLRCRPLVSQRFDAIVDEPLHVDLMLDLLQELSSF
jgi:hypothetical protein